MILANFSAGAAPTFRLSESPSASSGNSPFQRDIAAAKVVIFRVGDFRRIVLIIGAVMRGDFLAEPCVFLSRLRESVVFCHDGKIAKKSRQGHRLCGWRITQMGQPLPCAGMGAPRVRLGVFPHMRMEGRKPGMEKFQLAQGRRQRPRVIDQVQRQSVGCKFPHARKRQKQQARQRGRGREQHGERRGRRMVPAPRHQFGDAAQRRMGDFALDRGGQIHRARVVVEDMADLMGENASDLLVRKSVQQAFGDRDTRIVGAAKRIGVHARDRQQKQFRQALHPGANANIKQDCIKLRRLGASQGPSAQCAQGGARLALRRLQIGLDLAKRLAHPARFAIRLSAKVEQVDEAREDTTRMMRVKFPRQPPPQLSDGRLSARFRTFGAKRLALGGSRSRRSRRVPRA